MVVGRISVSGARRQSASLTELTPGVEVAVKLERMRSEGDREAAIGEAKLMASIRHRRLVTLYGVLCRDACGRRHRARGGGGG